MHILLVEDDVPKLRRIVSCIIAVPGMQVSDIEECRYASDARDRLRHKKYELLLIDINIPDYLNEDAKIDGGIRLLEELEDDEGYITPDHILGITAFEDAHRIAQAPFANRSWQVIQYRPESEDWQVQIQSKVEHVLSATRGNLSAKMPHRCELAIICALADPELKAVKALPWSWSRANVANDYGIYYEGSFPSPRSEGTVVAASAPRMGMAAAAILTTKVLYSFRPRLLAMVGIAGGIRGAVNLGDIVAADGCWDYGAGKFDVAEGKGRFRVSPHQIGLSAEVRSRLLRLADDKGWLNSVRNAWPAQPPPHELTLRLGPVASGAAVLADERVVSGVLDQNRKTLAIDMEGYGVLSAVEEGPLPRATAVVLKSVSDFADESKGDEVQSYAAFACAQVLARFAMEYL